MEQHLEMHATPPRLTLRDAIDDTHPVYGLAGATIRLVGGAPDSVPGWAPGPLAEMLRDFATALYDDLAEVGSIPSGALEPAVRIPTTEGSKDVVVEITFPTSARGLFESLLEALHGPTALAA